MKQDEILKLGRQALEEHIEKFNHVKSDMKQNHQVHYGEVSGILNNYKHDISFGWIDKPNQFVMEIHIWWNTKMKPHISQVEREKYARVLFERVKRDINRNYDDTSRGNYRGKTCKALIRFNDDEIDPKFLKELCRGTIESIIDSNE